MGKYLITGRGGSGKSTINRTLLERGFNSFDSDEVAGLVRSEDLAGQPIDVDWSGYVDYSKVAFNWQGQTLKNFLIAHPDIFLCGSASNQLSFHPLFDKVFVLTLDKATHKQRLMNRESEYGKHPDMQAYLLEEQQVFSQEAIQLGAIAIDATRSPNETVDAILKQVDDIKRLARTSN